MMRFLPKSLQSQMIAIFIIGVLGAGSCVVLLAIWNSDNIIHHHTREQRVLRIENIVEVLDPLTKQERARVVGAMRNPVAKIRVLDESIRIPERRQIDDPAVAVYRDLLQKAFAGQREVVVTLLQRPEKKSDRAQHPFFQRTLKKQTRETDQQTLSLVRELRRGWFQARLTQPLFFHVQVALSDGQWLQVQWLHREGLNTLASSLFLWLALSAIFLVVLLITFFAVRWVTKPLRKLAYAAENLGRDLSTPPLDETGPNEVAQASKAFNTMQARLKNYIDEKTHLMAAISHDLKTPITRLRLRAELIADETTKKKIIHDLQEMDNMVSAALSAMRGVDDEACQRIDMMALLESVQADCEDIGGHLTLAGDTLSPYWGRPIALRRALDNIVTNALRYGGGKITIKLEENARAVLIHVLDEGPGIPEGERDKVFEPFVRLEASRSKATGGCGLGLSIVRTIIQAHGGTCRLLANKPQGLHVEIQLPRSTH